jgi:hypothetical protein
MGCSNENHLRIVLGEGLEATEIVPVSAEIGISLMHQLMDPSTSYSLGLLLGSLHCCGLDVFTQCEIMVL